AAAKTLRNVWHFRNVFAGAAARTAWGCGADRAPETTTARIQHGGTHRSGWSAPRKKRTSDLRLSSGATRCRHDRRAARPIRKRGHHHSKDGAIGSGEMLLAASFS